MQKYEFKLAPAYCRKNGIAILEQNGASIKFLVQNMDDELLKRKLRSAFCEYLRYVKNQDDCTVNFLKIPHVEFIGGNKTVLMQYGN